MYFGISVNIIISNVRKIEMNYRRRETTWNTLPWVFCFHFTSCHALLIPPFAFFYHCLFFTPVMSRTTSFGDRYCNLETFKLHEYFTSKKLCKWKSLWICNIAFLAFAKAFDGMHFVTCNMFIGREQWCGPSPSVFALVIKVRRMKNVSLKRVFHMFDFIITFNPNGLECSSVINKILKCIVGKWKPNEWG